MSHLIRGFVRKVTPVLSALAVAGGVLTSPTAAVAQTDVPSVSCATAVNGYVAAHSGVNAKGAGSCTQSGWYTLTTIYYLNGVQVVNNVLHVPNGSAHYGYQASSPNVGCQPGTWIFQIAISGPGGASSSSWGGPVYTDCSANGPQAHLASLAINSSPSAAVEQPQGGVPVGGCQAKEVGYTYDGHLITWDINVNCFGFGWTMVTAETILLKSVSTNMQVLGSNMTTINAGDFSLHRIRVSAGCVPDPWGTSLWQIVAYFKVFPAKDTLPVQSSVGFTKAATFNCQ